jgi:type III restriction enzyme
VQQHLTYDITIPITKPRLEYNIRKLSQFDVAVLKPVFEQEELAEVFRVKLKLDFATTETEVHHAVIDGGRNWRASCHASNAIGCNCNK